ncbi:MAG TPA: LptA/OstA family protein, partial [Gemmataceae bacterium]|nr:LptA/OstA family protein [Gemmataceae bacterium]
EQEMKLTYVRFENLMKASNLTNTASFWGSVRVLNFPCNDNDEHRDIDLDTILAKDLPPRAMYLRCNRLKVQTTQKQERNPQEPNKVIMRNYQQMEADGQVAVRAREFNAQADQMTFNEEKDQVIFIGIGDRLAVFEKRSVKGQPAQSLRARKIFYIRSTGKAWADEVNSIQQGN